MILEIDFKLYQAKNATKVFKFLDETGDNNYDFTGTASVVFLLYIDPDNPVEITASLDAGNAEATFLFVDPTHTGTLGNFEYRIEDRKTAGDVIAIGKGNFIVEEYIPFSQSIQSFIDSELPVNLSLTENYKNQRITYWQLVLQNAVSLTDAQVFIESNWTVLWRALLAKLVVYDSLVLASKGSFIQFLGGSYTDAETIGGGGIKAVETGPTRVEYYDTATSAKQAFTATQGNMSMFDTLKEDICGLAQSLRVKVHMCEGNKIPISPQYHQNPDWDYPTLTDPYDGIEQQSSQG